MQIRDLVRGGKIETQEQRHERLTKTYSSNPLVDARRLAYERVAREEIEELIRNTSTGLPFLRRSVHVADMRAGYNIIGERLGATGWWRNRAEVTARHAVNDRLSIHVLRKEARLSADEYYHHTLVNSLRNRRPEAKTADVVDPDPVEVENELQRIMREEAGELA
jgi:hypothetical protein